MVSLRKSPLAGRTSSRHKESQSAPRSPARAPARRRSAPRLRRRRPRRASGRRDRERAWPDPVALSSSRRRGPPSDNRHAPRARRARCPVEGPAQLADLLFLAAALTPPMLAGVRPAREHHPGQLDDDAPPPGGSGRPGGGASAGGSDTGQRPHFGANARRSDVPCRARAVILLGFGPVGAIDHGALGSSRSSKHPAGSSPSSPRPPTPFSPGFRRGGLPKRLRPRIVPACTGPIVGTIAGTVTIARCVPAIRLVFSRWGRGVGGDGRAGSFHSREAPDAVLGCTPALVPCRGRASPPPTAGTWRCAARCSTSPWRPWATRARGA